MPAGPFNSPWSFSGFRDAVGIDIVGRSLEEAEQGLCS